MERSKINQVIGVFFQKFIHSIFFPLSIAILFIYIWASFMIGAKYAIVGITPILLLYCFLGWGVCALGKPKQALFEIKKYDYIVSVAIAITVGIFFIAFIETEDTIYVWDSGTYWEKTLMLYASMTHSVTHTLTNILSSINESNYNNLVPFLLATPLHLAGGSREAFIGIVFFLFYVPTIFLFSLTLKIIIPNSKLPLWLTTIIGLTLPMMFVPILGGWLDMSSVLLLAFLLLCFFSNPKDTVFDKSYCLSIAIAVLLILVFRRTFSIWVGAFVVVVILHYALLAIRSSTKSERMFLLKQLVMTYGVAALIVAAFMFTLFFGLAKMLLFDNHAAAYIGYKSGNSQLIELFSTIGAPYVILITLGTILSFLKHISKAKVASLYILSIIVVLLFWRIQDMGEQHYYLLAPQILLMIYASCEILRRSLRWSWIKGLLSLSLSSYASMPVFNSFSQPYIKPLFNIFSAPNHTIGSIVLILMRYLDLLGISRMVQECSSIHPAAYLAMTQFPHMLYSVRFLLIFR